MITQEDIDLVIAKIKEKYFLVEKTYNFSIETTELLTDAFVENVIFETCKYFKMTKDELILSKRKKFNDDYSFPEVKFIIFHMCRELPEEPIQFGKIGRYFGKNHATVLHGTEKCRDLIRLNPSFARDYKQIEKAVNGSMRL